MTIIYLNFLTGSIQFVFDHIVQAHQATSLLTFKMSTKPSSMTEGNTYILFHFIRHMQL